MFAVNISLGNVTWRLLFKNEEKAQEAFTKLEHCKLGKEPVYRVEDDYGQVFSGGDQITALLYEDFDKAKMANVELFLHGKRVEGMQMKAAQGDPSLRANSLMNGPAMLSPMGGMPRN